MTLDRPLVDIEAAATISAPSSPGLFDELAPWRQVALLHQLQLTDDRQGRIIAPRLKLRGDRDQLRALRAAEMNAWDDRGALRAAWPSLAPSWARPVDTDLRKAS